MSDYESLTMSDDDEESSSTSTPSGWFDVDEGTVWTDDDDDDDEGLKSSKLITTTDLEKEPIVLTRAMERFSIPEGKEFVDLLVNDLKEEIWNFCLTIHPMPALTDGWLEFVRAKDLVPDDIVTFYKLQDEIFGDEYKVEINSEYKWGWG
ncbi:hypothetical protein Dsin_015566 [Dipteronia sinensis]|uniref:TF-B3 domain-containing protein n=1 Tax=Dipteronia sinensis TaxID=43782 RepID=A0AAE0E555_9ROSI|nr:hypothetical protein Dsin_015566 [Dipteronia sinensis]